MADGTGTMREGFTSNEFGATCGYKFDLAKGRAWLIGGGFVQDFDYSQTVQFRLASTVSPAPGSTGTLSFKDDYQPGYRLGVAYEIPEIALRAQLMYRSAVDHSPGGGNGDTFYEFATWRALVFPTTGSGTLASVGRTEGPERHRAGLAGIRLGQMDGLERARQARLHDHWASGSARRARRVLEYYYRDGWTVTGGVGHSFSETISGVLGLTWDRGVSTTEDTLSDTYTAAAGVSIKDKLGGEVRFGGAISYLTSASVSADPTAALTPGDPGNSFAYTVDGDWSYAVSLGYKIAW